MEVNWSDQEAKVQKAIADTVQHVNTQAKSCAVRASNELRNSALNVLRGQRSGKRYKKPHTKTYYTASAPGEPPAVRSGMLRMSWGIKAEGNGKGDYTAGIETEVKYAEKLNDGTPGGKIKPRPFKDRIIEHARPNVVQIFQSGINK